MPARAQQVAGQLEAITVTAQKRAENIQDVPLSITAISAESLEKRGDRGFIDYASSIPNLSFSYGQNGGGDNAQGVSQGRGVTIRGIAGPDTTNYYIDDTPVPVSVDLRVLDLQRVEVLRGPQGTLYGSASLGGTVRLITQQPSTSDTSGKVEGELYDVDHGGIASYEGASGNVPVPAADLAFKAVAFSSYEPGFLTRTYNDPLALNATGNTTGPAVTIDNVGAVQTTGVLLSALFTPTSLPNFTVQPTFIWQKVTGDGLPLADNYAANSIQRRVENVPEGYGDDLKLWSLTLRYGSNIGHIISSTSYLVRDAADTEDGSDVTQLLIGLPKLVPTTSSSDQHTDQFTEELRFESSFTGPFGLIAGVFFTHETSAYDQSVLSPGANAVSGGALGTDVGYLDHQPSVRQQLAEFANLTYEIGSKLQISAGLRSSNLQYRQGLFATGFFVGPGGLSSEGATSNSQLTERYTVSYHFTPEVMSYANVASGVRPGGIGGGVPSSCDADLIADGLPLGSYVVRNDTVWSYDLGTKISLADRRATLDVALFHIDWRNMQQTILLPTCGFYVTVNDGAATSDGGEVEAEVALTTNLKVGLATGYTNARITKSAPGSPATVGQPLTGVPQWTASTSIDYEIPTLTAGVLFIRGQYSYVDERRSFNNDAVLGRVLPSYNIVNLRAGSDYKSNWELALFARNLFNTRANYGDELAEVVEYPARPRYVVNTPRQVGLAIRRTF
jgi:outer membrane receptor protein involved in Fe transport